MLYVHTRFLLAQNIWKLVWKYWNVLLEIIELLIITHSMLIYNFICGLISLLQFIAQDNLVLVRESELLIMLYLSLYFPMFRK